MGHEHVRMYFSEIQNAIVDTKEMLNQGQLVDLSYCDAMVQKYCNALQRLPRDEAQQYQNSLLVIDKELKEIAEGLKERRDALKQEIMQLNAREKAGDAYEKAKRGNPK